MVDPKKIRELILRSSFSSSHGHIPTSFSVVEIIVATYASMRHDHQNPYLEDRDIFILSKGHASLGYYCCLAEMGYFITNEINTFGKAGSKFGCHPDRMKLPCVEASCGSLGHGIGMGVGMALAFKIKKNNRKVFTLIGDGESNEGTVWEAVMVAVDQGLNNITILYDNNGSQSRCLQIQNPADRFLAFGCDVYEVNGHNIQEIKHAIMEPQTKTKCIVCNTEKGYGCKTLMENMFAWHRRSPNEEELDQLIKELNAQTV